MSRKKTIWKSEDGLERVQAHVIARAYCESRVSDVEAVFAVSDVDWKYTSSTGRLRVTGWRHEELPVEQGKFYRLVYRSCDRAGQWFVDECRRLRGEWSA